MIKVWSDRSWNDYTFWVDSDIKMVRRINSLIKDVERDPFRGIGKPEPLKNNLAGLWSRRINDEHRLVYRVRGQELDIIACRGHYND